MQVTIELPEEIARQLQTERRSLERSVLEALALEGYRSGRLTQAQLRRLLGFKNRLETDAFLKANKVYLEYSVEDLERDRETIEQALAK